MVIQVLSDLHLEFDEFTVETDGVDVVVLAGDIHISDHGIRWAVNNIKDIPVLYVLGNHEYYKEAYPNFIKKFERITEGTNVYILENSTFTYEDITFYGCTLWTDFNLLGNSWESENYCMENLTDFKKIRTLPSNKPLKTLDIITINDRSVKWLREQKPHMDPLKSIVITHHAPSVFSIPEEKQKEPIMTAYASHLDTLVADLSPRYWIHGHLHNSSDYTIDDTRVICNPRGYPGKRNPNFFGKYIIEI